MEAEQQSVAQGAASPALSGTTMGAMKSFEPAFAAPRALLACLAAAVVVLAPDAARADEPADGGWWSDEGSADDASDADAADDVEEAEDDDGEEAAEVAPPPPPVVRHKKHKALKVRARRARTWDRHRSGVVEEEDRARFRGGVSAEIGAYRIDGETLGLFGLQGRLGVQIRDWIGLYAAPSFQFGFGEWDVMGRVGLGLVPELTVGDLFFIGAGPELFAAAGVTDEHGVFGTAANIGVLGRAGFAFGSKRPGRRHAFTLAGDVRIDFYRNDLGVAPTLSLGYDAF